MLSRTRVSFLAISLLSSVALAQPNFGDALNQMKNVVEKATQENQGSNKAEQQNTSTQQQGNQSTQQPKQTDKSIEAYHLLLERQSKQESDAQYSGDDETVRKRLNLPPKLPSFDEWVKQSAAQTPSVVLQNTPPPTTATSGAENRPNVSPEMTRSSFTYKSQKIIFYLITLTTPLIFFYFNTRAYKRYPKLRRVLIAPLLGSAKSESIEIDDAIQKQINNKRQLTELGMFFLAAIVAFFAPLITYFASSDGEQFELIKGVSPGLTEWLVVIGCSLATYLVAHFSYLAGITFVSKATQCPKCKTPYARKLINRHDEPKSTYSKRPQGQAPGSTQVNHYEVGITHSDWACVSCNHEWHTTKRYERQIGMSGHA